MLGEDEPGLLSFYLCCGDTLRYLLSLKEVLTPSLIFFYVGLLCNSIYSQVQLINSTARRFTGAINNFLWKEVVNNFPSQEVVNNFLSHLQFYFFENWQIVSFFWIALYISCMFLEVVEFMVREVVYMLKSIYGILVIYMLKLIYGMLVHRVGCRTENHIPYDSMKTVITYYMKTSAHDS